jgi:hypothetical protein
MINHVKKLASLSLIIATAVAALSPACYAEPPIEVSTTTKKDQYEVNISIPERNCSAGWVKLVTTVTVNKGGSKNWQGTLPDVPQIDFSSETTAPNEVAGEWTRLYTTVTKTTMWCGASEKGLKMQLALPRQTLAPKRTTVRYQLELGIAAIPSFPSDDDDPDWGHQNPEFAWARDAKIERSTLETVNLPYTQ